MLNQVETVAKELEFNVAGEEMEQIFNQQKLSDFVPQQQSQQQPPLATILDFPGFLLSVCLSVTPASVCRYVTCIYNNVVLIICGVIREEEFLL